MAPHKQIFALEGCALMEKPPGGRKPLSNDAFLAELQTALTKVAAFF